MGKERIALEQIPYTTLLRRKVDAEAGVEQDVAIQGDATPIRPLDPGYAFERHGLTATRGTEERQDLMWAINRETYVKRKVGQALFYVNITRHGDLPLLARFGPSAQAMGALRRESAARRG